MKARVVFVIFFFALFQSGCSAISNAISSITSLDCDNWLLEESNSSLNESCRELAGYLDADSTSLNTSITQVLSAGSIAEDKRVYLQLTDSTGQPLTNISAEDITVEVSEDEGTTYDEVDIDDVSLLEDSTSLEASIAMIIDYSGSVTDYDLEDVNDGLESFYDILIPDPISSVFQSAIIKFSTEVSLEQDFTTTKANLESVIADTDFEREYTSLYDAIYEGVTLIREEDTPLKMIVLFTDGIDNDSSHNQNDAIGLAQANDVPVCVVGVSFADVDTLSDIASDTGCFYVYKALFSNLYDAFEIFGDQINGLTVVQLADSFDVSSGQLKITIDAGESAAREVIQSF